jgi:hypothetical protein
LSDSETQHYQGFRWVSFLNPTYDIMTFRGLTEQY